MSDDINISGGTPRKPTKLGEMHTINVETGEVVATKKNSFTMLPCAADKCQECATEHNHDEPHNQRSLYYQNRFYATHGRWPTWTDSMQHCTDDVKKLWRMKIIEVMEQHGLEVPEDLLENKEVGR